MLSSHEPTWDMQLKQHTCCGSTHSYHLSFCPNRNKTIPGRSSDPDFLAVQSMKTANPELTSKDIARELNMPLDQVNELWSQ